MTTAKLPLVRLQQMLEAFVAGTDTSPQFASQIEGVLLDHFREDETFEDLLVALASYRPGGGDFLFNETRLRQVCAEALIEVRSRL